MARPKTVNIALIGTGFMGRAHSNAWGQAARFFSPPAVPILHTVCDLDAGAADAFARRWGWRNAAVDWRAVVASAEIDLVDIVTPNHLHAPMALAALAAGKHVACEKPLARTLEEAEAMAAAAQGKQSFVWFNYRRAPAVALAHLLVRKGRLGDLRHVRAHYLQDWADESVPLAWRFDGELAGSGAHGDLNAHIVDLARFVTGLEVEEIGGAAAATFIAERALPAGAAAGGIAAGLKARKARGKVSVDDALAFLCRFAGGALGVFEAARQATGHQNDNFLELNGTKGSLRFAFERMNELDYYDATAERAVQGWTTIMATHAGAHPYLEAWWPDAHLIGYEHCFANQAYDILLALAGKRPTVPLPDFADGLATQRVLEAALAAARARRAVRLDP